MLVRHRIITFYQRSFQDTSTAHSRDLGKNLKRNLRWVVMESKRDSAPCYLEEFKHDLPPLSIRLANEVRASDSGCNRHLYEYH